MSPCPLRVYVITEEDPFYLPEFFREFLPALPRDRFDILGIDITPPLNQTSRRALARKLYGFYGGRDFARLLGRYAVARALDLTAPRGMWCGTIDRLAGCHGIACDVVKNVNAPAYVDQVPRLAAVNVHTGPLPRYRGMMPVFWQMYDRQKQISVTLHTMTPDIDLGKVLLRREVPLNGDRNLDEVIRKMKREGAQALVELLERFHAGTVQAVAMDRSREHYHSFPGRAEAVRFRLMGYRLV